MKRKRNGGKRDKKNKCERVGRKEGEQEGREVEILRVEGRKKDERRELGKEGGMTRKSKVGRKERNSWREG